MYINYNFIFYIKSVLETFSFGKSLNIQSENDKMIKIMKYAIQFNCNTEGIEIQNC